MPRLTVNAPAQTQIHTKRYSSFKGVDFSADPTQVDDSRSPWAVNVISDEGGCPQKRPGWRKLAEVPEAVHGIHLYKKKDKLRYVVHAGDKLYSWLGGEDSPEELMSGLTGTSSDGFMWKNRLYILTGAEYVYAEIKDPEDGEEETDTLTAGHVKDIAYAPITKYNIKAQREYGNAEAAGGENYEVSNLVTKQRRNNFVIDRRLGEFSTAGINVNALVVLFLDKEIDKNATTSDIKVETKDGKKIEGLFKFAKYNSQSGAYEGEDKQGETENVYCTAVCANYHDLNEIFVKDFGITADENIVPTVELTVTFPAKPDKEDLPTRIPKCRIHEFFNNRLFVAGNPDYANADYFSELNEPTYFKEISYTEIGSSPIRGYLKTGEQLAVIKESSLQDVGIYLRRGEFDAETGQYFPVRQGVSSTGAIGGNVFASLVDDPMYVSSDGVMGIIADNISGERIIHQRSTRINNKLLREKDLNKAICTVWNGYYIICVNGGIYLADSRQRTYARNTTNTFEYEWFYWSDIPLTCITPHDDTLYFGTADGKLCRLNTDMTDESGITPEAYADYPNGIDGEAQAIVAEWSTKFDDDGDFMLKKTMVRRGNGVFLKACRRGNVKIAVRTDNELEHVIAYRKRGVFEFNTDFDNFTFDKLPKLTAAINKKVKKYTAIQVICRSDEAKNDFGILGIERRFTTGYFNK